MEAGEKETRKIFEDNTTRNVQTVVDHANETRTMAKEAFAKANQIELIVHNLTAQIEALKIQLATVQSIVFRGGTSGD